MSKEEYLHAQKRLVLGREMLNISATGAGLKEKEKQEKKKL